MLDTILALEELKHYVEGVVKYIDRKLEEEYGRLPKPNPNAWESVAGECGDRPGYGSLGTEGNRKKPI